MSETICLHGHPLLPWWRKVTIFEIFPRFRRAIFPVFAGCPRTDHICPYWWLHLASSPVVLAVLDTVIRCGQTIERGQWMDLLTIINIHACQSVIRWLDVLSSSIHHWLMNNTSLLISFYIWCFSCCQVVFFSRRCTAYTREKNKCRLYKEKKMDWFKHLPFYVTIWKVCIKMYFFIRNLACWLVETG